MTKTSSTGGIFQSCVILVTAVLCFSTPTDYTDIFKNFIINKDDQNILKILDNY